MDNGTLEPDWVSVQIPCPTCGDQLVSDFVWAGDFLAEYEEVYEDEKTDDYPIWFLVCDECQVNYDYNEDGTITIIDESEEATND